MYFTNRYIHDTRSGLLLLGDIWICHDESKSTVLYRFPLLCAVLPSTVIRFAVMKLSKTKLLTTLFFIISEKMSENSPSSFVSEKAMVTCRICLTTLRKKYYKTHLKKIHPRANTDDLSGKDQLKISGMFLLGGEGSSKPNEKKLEVRKGKKTPTILTQTMQLIRILLEELNS